MFGMAMDRRKLVTVMALALLAGCKMIPKGPPEKAPPTTGPSADVLPADTTRHRVALLVPLTGSNAAVGQSIANAATMALLDTNAQNLRVTTYDTSINAGNAAMALVAAAVIAFIMSSTPDLMLFRVWVTASRGSNLAQL